MRAERGAVARSLEAEAELAQPRDDVPRGLGLGLGSGSCLGLRFGPRFRMVLRLGRFAPSLLTLLAHEPCPERALGCVLIVRATQEPQSVHARLAPSRDRGHMVVLESRARLAALPRRARERAAPAVALPDLAPDFGRDIPNVAGTA